MASYNMSSRSITTLLPTQNVIKEDHHHIPLIWVCISHIPTVLCLLILIYYTVYMSVHLLAIVYGYFRLHSWKAPAELMKGEEWPGVSVVKPIIGVDNNLKENLQSFFKLSYPKFELLLCVSESETTPPPSLPIIQELQRLYPRVHVRLFMGASPIGINPKINNIFDAYQSAQYNLLWLSDSNILAQDYTLTELVSKIIHPQVGLVHQLPYVTYSKGSMTDLLYKVYFGTQHSRVYLWANLIGRNCATGMSWLIKKSAIEQEGGLLMYTDYLAEDYFIGKALWNRGWKFRLSSIPALQNPGTRSLALFQSRLIRWCRLRATMMPLPVLFEPFTECILLGILGAITVHCMTGIDKYLFFCGHCIVWFICDLILIHIIENGPVRPLWKLLLVWLLREVWALPLYLASCWSREVTWRGVRFRLHLGGKATKID